MNITTISIDEIGLSVRSVNCLHRAEIHTVGQMMSCTEESLLQIRNMGRKSAEEILQKIAKYKEKELHPETEMIIDAEGGQPEEKLHSAEEQMPDSGTLSPRQKLILRYVWDHDVKVGQMDFSVRVGVRLITNKYHFMSDLVFANPECFRKIQGMGSGCIAEIEKKIKEYLDKNDAQIQTFISENEAAFWDDGEISRQILKLFQQVKFEGMHLKDILEKLQLPETVPQERVKNVIGKLLAEKQLEYVDYRLYRVYPKFADWLKECANISDRDRECIARRLQGETLESIAQNLNLTRERIRQIVDRGIRKIKSEYTEKTGLALFDEDYYRYLYKTYAFDKKEGSQWLGIPSYVWKYLELIDVKQGKKNLQDALDDHQNLEAGLLLKIRNYLNKDKLFIDGKWVPKKRAELEEVVARKFCTSEVTFDEFTQLYNHFLEEEEVPYDEDIYYTDAVYRTRKNRLADAHFLLWKYGEKIRYYDIDGQDYSELLNTLNLDSYENIELSTLKFMMDYPDIMKKYDVRDQYELHNLLRKIIPERSYHDYHCGYMPMICFGTFDRVSAVLDILFDNAPLTQEALLALVREEYGYDSGAVPLRQLDRYYYNGIYTVDQKKMSAENMEILQSALMEDFYFIDEIKKIYCKLIPEADREEINAFTLKTMGFSVYCRYAIQHYDSIDTYFTDILTKTDITDISQYRTKFTYVQGFSMKLNELQRSLQVIEYAPNQLINIRKLEGAGITKDMLRCFCEEVWQFVKDRQYFSIQSLKQDGFESELFDFGFEDWFYGSILLSDERFSNGRFFGNQIFFKGEQEMMIKYFEVSLIEEKGVIDALDLVSLLTDRFGCKIDDRLDVIYKVKGTSVYYDRILDRLYANEERYYRELDEAEDA